MKKNEELLETKSHPLGIGLLLRKKNKLFGNERNEPTLKELFFPQFKKIKSH